VRGVWPGVFRQFDAGMTCELKNLRTISNPARGAIHARVYSGHIGDVLFRPPVSG
jgi:hypothetical protein